MRETKKVLVVDDELGIRTLLFEVLSRRGFQVSLASDGMESLERMENEPFDLVVTDINMPKLDGVGMLKTMKEKGRKEKVIVITGNTFDTRLQDPEMYRVDSHFYKPFGMAAFLSTVDSLLREEHF